MIKNHSLEKTISRLRNEETRWDAILELKLIQNPKDVGILIELLKDEDWIVRWAVAEKLGDYKDPSCIAALSELLVDPDIHVRKNAKKALAKYQSTCIPEIVPYLQNKDLITRCIVYQILMDLKEEAIPVLEKVIFPQNSIVASRILHAIWAIGGKSAEEALVRLLDSRHLRLQSILLLANLKSKKAMPKLIGLYKYPKYRRAILVAFKQIGEDYFFQYVINGYFSSKPEFKKNCEEIIVKVGKFIIPSLINFAMSHGHLAEQALQVGAKVSVPTLIEELEKNLSNRRGLPVECVEFLKKIKRDSV